MAKSLLAGSLLLLLVILPSLASAAVIPKPNNQTMLSNAYSEISCKTNFTATFAGQAEALMPNSSQSIGAQVTALQQDASQLQSYASAGNVKQFRSYVAGTYDPQLRLVGTTILSSARASNLSRSQIATLRSDYNATKGSFQQCDLNALVAFGEEKVSYYQQAIAAFQNRTTQIAAKNISTANLVQITDNATTEIVAPLQSALSSATTAAQARAAINSYCLFDGCRNGTNYHLEAKFATALLTGITTKLQTIGSLSNSTMLQAAISAKDNASSVLSQVGTKAYSGNQSQQIFGYIRQAVADIRALTSKK